MLALSPLVKKVSWASIGTLFPTAIQLLTLVVLARLLTPHEYGVVTAATLVIQFFVIFSEWGIPQYLIHQNLSHFESRQAAHVLSSILGIVMAALTIAFAPAIAEFFDEQFLSRVIFLYSLYFILTGYLASSLAEVQRKMDFKWLAMADTLSFIIGYAMISILLAFMGFSYWSLVIGYLCQLIIKSLVIFIRYPPCGMWISIKTTDLTELKNIIQFGAGQTLSRLGSFFGAQADSFIVAQQLGVTASGIYGRANQLVTMPTLSIGQIYDKVLFPYIASMQSEKTKAGNTFLFSVLSVFCFGVTMSVLGYRVSHFVVVWVLGDSWIAVAEPLAILCLAIPFRLLHKVSDPTARALGASYSRAWRHWLTAIFTLVGCYLAAKDGLAALCSVVVAVCLIDAVLLVGLCFSLLKLKLGRSLLAFSPGILSGIFTYGVFFVYQANVEVNNEIISVIFYSLVACLSMVIFIKFSRVYFPDA